jgi:hypothetical protein
MKTSTKVLIGLGVGAGFIGYKLFKLYQLSQYITYTPVGLDYKNGNVVVKMKIDNPVNTTLNMRPIIGKIQTKSGNIIATYKAPAFVIKQGVSYFTLNFKVNILNAGTELINALINKTFPALDMILTKQLPFGLSQTDVITIEAKSFA